MKRLASIALIPFVLCALTATGCGRNDEGLKIVIEEKAPPETATGPGTEAPKGTPTPAVETPGPETAKIEGPTPALTLSVTTVVSLVESDPDIARLLAVIPARMVVAARPADSLWDVRLSLREVLLFDLTVADGGKTILDRKPHPIAMKKVKDGLEKSPGRVHREAMGRPVIPLSAAVKSALAAEGVRSLDYAKGLSVSVGINRLEENPRGEVVIVYGDGGPTVHVTLDGMTGTVLGVREE